MSLLSLVREQIITTKIYVPLLHLYDYWTMLVIDIVHRYHSCIGLLPLPLEACMTPLSGTMNASPQGEGIQVSSSSEVSVPSF